MILNSYAALNIVKLEIFNNYDQAHIATKRCSFILEYVSCVILIDTSWHFYIDKGFRRLCYSAIFLKQQKQIQCIY